jgi:glycosyltransferase involved in cell wall biosynthesis
MKVALITRSTLYTVPGGDTVQIEETARHLQDINVKARIFLSNQKINYSEFDLLHFFNLTRPADILHHTHKSKTPYVITPILVDYAEYDAKHRRGFSGQILRSFTSPEYAKAIARWLLFQDHIPAKTYLWKGHRKAIQEVLLESKMVLPNSIDEGKQLQSFYPSSTPHSVIPNGINEHLFYKDTAIEKDERLIVCAARIEGLKNQLSLIKALNHTQFRLLLVGDPAPNHKSYYKQCRKAAASNIEFTGRLDQQQLGDVFRKAKVHVLPSWFETCGLSSLEAAASGCNVVVTEKGFTSSYFGREAFYCDPGNAESIYAAVQMAANSDNSKQLLHNIATKFTWRQTALKTKEAYKTCLKN